MNETLGQPNTDSIDLENLFLLEWLAMASIHPTVIETLLNMAESDVLDFKRDQYPYAGATDDQKSELLKDILAFSNSWKTSEAHILIGADENPGGRATVVGITNHLDDADIQQFVNSKTSVPVFFEYIATNIESKQIGVIRIRNEQQRPIFLKRDFGKLKSNTVYLRRGSSTMIAQPDEIARMGASAVMVGQEPIVALEWANPDGRQLLGSSTILTSTSLKEQSRVRKSEFSYIKSTISSIDPFQDVRPELNEYKKKMALLQPISLYIHNKGRVLIEDARVVIEVPQLDGLLVADQLPQRPSRFRTPDVSGLFNVINKRPTTHVDRLGSSWEVIARMGKIQPNSKGWSEPFWVGSTMPCELTLPAHVYADNIPVPVEFSLTLNIQVTEGRLEDAPDED